MRYDEWNTEGDNNMPENGKNPKKTSPPHRSARNPQPTQAEMKERFRIEATPELLARKLLNRRERPASK